MNWINVTVKLADLQPWEHNPRTMTKRQAQRLIKSWKDLGQFNLVSIGPADENGKHPLYDGHQRVAALLQEYGPQYQIDARESEQALTEDFRRYLTAQANLPVGAWRMEDIAGWPEAKEWGFDQEMLATWDADGAALATMLEAEQPHGDADAEPQIDRAAELNEKWQVQRGDLWRIGEHRLLCGDSTRREDVGIATQDLFLKLCITDPPYGVDYDPNWRNDAAAAGLLSYAARRVGTVNNDSISDWSSAWLLFGGDVLYCWHDATAENIFQTGIESSGFEIRNQIVWVKSNFPISRGHYTWKHESCWYAVRSGHDAGWIGDAKQCTVWDGSLDSNVDGGHSTQKPVWVMAKAIANHSGDVYEPFAGSGTTLVACQNLQRKCRAIEISPNYCAVILERMSTAFTGIEIERIES